MKTIAILNMKGGVGKTTTAINLAYILATEYDQRVLVVDADGQANTTRTLMPNVPDTGLATLLLGYADCYDQVVYPTVIRNLSVLPASNDLWAVDLSCVTQDGTDAFRGLHDMRVCIEEDDAYDVMIVDCPPSFSVACISAIRASDCIVIPVLPDAFSAEGMADLIAQIDGVRELHPTVRVGGCLINQWHNSDVVNDATEYLREECPVPVYDTVIRRTDKVLESTWAKQPVLMWSPYSSAAKDYRAWAKELAEKEGLNRG